MLRSSRTAGVFLSVLLMAACATSASGNFQTLIRSADSSEVFRTSEGAYRIVVGAPVFPGGDLSQEGRVFVTAIYGALARAGLADGYKSMVITECSAKRRFRGSQTSVESECEAMMFRDAQPRDGNWRLLDKLVAAAAAQKRAVLK